MASSSAHRFTTVFFVAKTRLVRLLAALDHHSGRHKLFAD
jgi:hypothetical protein